MMVISKGVLPESGLDGFKLLMDVAATIPEGFKLYLIIAPGAVSGGCNLNLVDLADIVESVCVPDGCAQVGGAECEPAQPRTTRELHQLFKCLDKGKSKSAEPEFIVISCVLGRNRPAVAAVQS
jgi:hypothetical protein